MSSSVFDRVKSLCLPIRTTCAVLKWQSIFLAVIVVSCAWAVADDRSPVRLSNSQLVLRFDRRSGAWIGFADTRSGEELVTGLVPRTMILPWPIRKLDAQAIRRP